MRLTRVLFRVSDTFAYLLICFSVVSAVGFALLRSEAAHMDHQPIDWAAMIGVSAVWLATALGAYGLTRRKPFCLLLVLLPSLALIVTDSYVPALVYAGLALVIFGSPLALAFLEVRGPRRSDRVG